VQGENIGFKETDYIDLIKVCRESWRNTNLYISLITERKDIQTDYVLQANQIIRSACEITQDLGIHVSIIEQFKPGEDMFHDDVHLNNKGVATIVKHIKGAVGLSSSRAAKHANTKHLNKQNPSVSVKRFSNASSQNVPRSDPAPQRHSFTGGPFVKPNSFPNIPWQNPFQCMWPPYPMWPPMPPHQFNGDRSM
jgi:hypothetical protein